MPKKNNPYPVPAKPEIIPAYLDGHDMATLLGVSKDTLKKWRLGDRRATPPA